MMLIAGFDWDKGNREKCRKHGVSVAEIEFVLRKAPAIAPDPGHSHGEDRFIAVGRNAEGRLLFVAFTLRIRKTRHTIRPISARYMHEKEVKRYEEKGSKTRDR